MRRSLPFALLAIFPVLALCLPHLGYVPLWDGGDYYNALRRAIGAPFSLSNYFLLDHPAAAYAIFLGLLLRLDPSRIEILNLTNLALFLCSVAFFRALQGRIFEDRISGLELDLSAALYALTPVLVSGIFNLNPDQGVAVFLVPYMWALVARRPWLAAFFGFCMANSKESGIALYAASLPLYLLTLERGPLRGRARSLAILSIPGALTALLLWHHARKAGEIVRTDFVPSIAATVFEFSPAAKNMLAALADIFVLNFNWIPASIIAAALLSLPFALGRRRGGAAKLCFAIAMFMAALYITTRVRPFNNARYFAPVFPLLLVVFHASLLRIVPTAELRIIFLSALWILFGASNLRTIDPLSKRVFGTFEFGRHELLAMDSMNGKRFIADEMVYNLEFLNLHYLENDLFASLKPDKQTILFAGMAADHWNPGMLDPVTFERSGDWRHGMLDVQFVGRDYKREIEELSREGRLPEMAYFVDLPNHDPSPGKKIIREHYRVTGNKIFGRGGYEIVLEEMVRKDK